MRCLLIFLSSFLIVMIIIPPIILITQKSRLLDEPLESRKVHKLNVPNSGGIAIFIGFFSCSLSLCTNIHQFNHYIDNTQYITHTNRNRNIQCSCRILFILLSPYVPTPGVLYYYSILYCIVIVSYCTI